MVLIVPSQDIRLQRAISGFSVFLFIAVCYWRGLRIRHDHRGPWGTTMPNTNLSLPSITYINIQILLLLPFGSGHRLHFMHHVLFANIIFYQFLCSLRMAPALLPCAYNDLSISSRLNICIIYWLGAYWNAFRIPRDWRRVIYDCYVCFCHFVCANSFVFFSAENHWHLDCTHDGQQWPDDCAKLTHCHYSMHHNNMQTIQTIWLRRRLDAEPKAQTIAR